jgi:TRAP-type mannitol/chloroaromatic compound transport system permease small subunit
MERLLPAAIARIDGFTARVGEAASWLCLGTVLLCFASVYLRYVLDIGLIWLQESYIWTHAAAVMLGSAYSLMKGGFVRVDMLFSRMSERGRAWVDLLGSLLFVAPFLWMLGRSGYGFFAMSWRMGERSAYEGGLPATYVLKGTLMAFVLLVGLQALAIALRALLVLLQRRPVPA